MIRKAEILDAQEDHRYGKGKLGSVPGVNYVGGRAYLIVAEHGNQQPD